MKKKQLDVPPGEKPSIADIEKMTRSRIAEVADDISPPKKVKVTSSFIRSCLYRNELGDGELFSAVHKGRFIYVPSIGWYYWNGVNWESDIFGYVLVAVDQIVQLYLQESAKISVQIQEILSTDPEKSNMRGLSKLRTQLERRAKKTLVGKRSVYDPGDGPHKRQSTNY